MTKRPTISVAMATYNGARFLQEQLASIADQTLLPYELVVTDDGSTDETIAILDEFAVSAPFPVRVERNFENLGSTGNFERAIRLCNGDIIALADQDDQWIPEKLARIESRMAERANGMVFSDGELMDERGKPLGGKLWDTIFPPVMQDRFAHGDQLNLILMRSFVTGATMAFRRAYRDLILPFPADLRFFIHDRWAAALIASVANVAIVRDPLIRYRQHGSQQLGVLIQDRWTQFRSRLAPDRAGLAEDRLAVARIAARLLDAGVVSLPRSAEVLRDKERNLDARLALPRSRPKRVLPVLRELASGRYKRVAHGPMSALKDVVG